VDKSCSYPMMVRCWRTSWEPQEEGVMSTIISFPFVIKPKFNRPLGERNHFRRLLLTGFWQGALPAPAAMWNLHTCNIPRFYQILGEFFCFYLCMCWLKIHRDLKLLSSLGALFENYLLFHEETVLRKLSIKYYSFS
jgi:hypothetical protein